MSWTRLIDAAKTKYGVRTFPALPDERIRQVLTSLEVENSGLESLYRTTNGLVYEWFKVIPIEDSCEIKRTWDGLAQANDPKHSKYLGGNDALLKRFVVFVEIGPSQAGVIERSSGKIWYEEDGDLHETDLTLQEFVEQSLREVAEL